MASKVITQGRQSIGNQVESRYDFGMIPFPPNRDLLYTHPEPVDIQRILHNAFQLNQDIAEQLEGHMPFGVALTQADEIHFIGYTGGPIDNGLIESVAEQLKAQRSNLKACARCAHVEIGLENGHRIHALQVIIEHENGPAICVYQPNQSQSKWWIEAAQSMIMTRAKP